MAKCFQELYSPADTASRSLELDRYRKKEFKMAIYLRSYTRRLCYEYVQIHAPYSKQKIIFWSTP